MNDSSREQRPGSKIIAEPRRNQELQLVETKGTESTLPLFTHQDYDWHRSSLEDSAPNTKESVSVDQSDAIVIREMADPTNESNRISEQQALQGGNHYSAKSLMRYNNPDLPPIIQKANVIVVTEDDIDEVIVEPRDIIKQNSQPQLQVKKNSRKTKKRTPSPKDSILSMPQVGESRLTPQHLQEEEKEIEPQRVEMYLAHSVGEIVPNQTGVFFNSMDPSNLMVQSRKVSKNSSGLAETPPHQPTLMIQSEILQAASQRSSSDDGGTPVTPALGRQGDMSPSTPVLMTHDSHAQVKDMLNQLNDTKNTRNGQVPLYPTFERSQNQSPTRKFSKGSYNRMYLNQRIQNGTGVEEEILNIRTPELDSDRKHLLNGRESPQPRQRVQSAQGNNSSQPEELDQLQEQPSRIQPSDNEHPGGFSFNRGARLIKDLDESSKQSRQSRNADVRRSLNVLTSHSKTDEIFTSQGQTNESFLTETEPQQKTTPQPDEVNSSDSSQKPRQIWDAAIELELDDVKQTKAQERSIKFLKETILKTGQSSNANQLLASREHSTDNWFAKSVFTLTVFIHIYNFFTCFFFMGIQGTPHGVWFVMEVTFEVIMLFEILIQFLLRTQWKWLFQDMYMLHTANIDGGLSKGQVARFCIVAVPVTMILTVSLHGRQEMQEEFGLACLRMLKLLRFDEVQRYFDLYDLNSRKKSAFSINRLIFIIFYFQVFCHFWTCIWLVTGRVDWSNDEAGWYKMDNFDMGPSMLEMYYESYFFIITTFSGAGFGNVIPSTNCEWFVDAILNLVGSSLFVCIFVDFTMEWMMRNLKNFDNDNLLDETLQFAESTSLPESLVFKIRYFYKDLNLEFQDFLLKKQIVSEMPHTIQGQVSIMLNREIIESVKFFQMASPEFISEISCLLSPQICMNDDYIVRIDDVADKMFFIHSGYIEILCRNNVSPMVYFGKGAYFGEIGVLVTGHRSVSVRSKSNSVIYFITKDDLAGLLEKFPDQKEFLTKVAQQRLQTTPFDNQPARSESELSSRQNTNKSKKQDAKNAEINHLFERATTTVMARKPWFNQRLDSLKHYILMPFSPIWWLWNLALIVAIMINSILVPYGIGFEHNYAMDPFIIISFIIYLIDIPVRVRTGVTESEKITIENRPILKSYLDKWILIDVLATFPFEYVFTIAGSPEEAKYVLLFRLLKVGRLIETAEVIRKNSRHSYSTACFFMELFTMFYILLHWLACMFGWLGRRELERNPRYDGNTFFKDFEARPFITLGPMADLPMWDQYTVCLYVAGSIMQAASYGDCIPSTMWEQTLVLVFLVITNTMRAFLFVRMAKFLGNLQKQQTIKIKKSNAIEQYMKACNLPKLFMKKIKKHTHLLRHDKSLWEGSEVLEHLPESLHTDINAHLQKSQVKQSGNEKLSRQMPALLNRQSTQVQNKTDDSANQGEQIELQLKPNLSKQYTRYLKMKHCKEVVVLMVITWNIWFIPLQFSYKIPFTGGYLVMDVVTMLVYLADIGFYYHTTSWLRNLDCVDDELLRRKDRKIKQSNQHMKKEISKQHKQIGITLIAFMPLSLIISVVPRAQSWNMYQIVVLCSLRLIKLQPLMKLFQQKQKDKLTQWRIISTVYIYYCFCHWCANIMIYMAIYDEDWTQNWLRRCPVPQAEGTRTDPHYRDDLSMLSVYVHALYYVVSTVSHVAIADITAVRQNEFIANTFFGGIGFFVYCLLYADITLLVSNAGSPNYKNFIRKRNEVISKLKSPSIPKQLVSQATLYLDYTYEVYEGVAQEDVLKELPDKLKTEFLLERYKNIVEHCLLFRLPQTTEINNSLAQDLIKNLTTQIFLSETYVLKVGQVCRDVIFLLEGNLNVLTIQKSDVLGQFAPGDYYATDLCDMINPKFNEKFFKKTQRDIPPKLKLEPSDNLESRSLVHLIARKFVTIGYLSEDQIIKLYQKHPTLKVVMKKSNRYIFDVGRKSVETLLGVERIPITRESVIKMLDGHYEKSSNNVYSDIVRCQRPIVNLLIKDEEDIPNISKNKKLYYIKQLPKETRQKFEDLFIEKWIPPEDPPFIKLCEEFIILEHSILRKLIIYVMFFNRLYVALAVPFFIGFNVRIQDTPLITEVVSHVISFVGFVLEFRTPVVKESGELTLEFGLVYKNYLKNGMLLDVLAFQPFNLVLPFLINQQDTASYEELGILIALTPLRMIRLASVWRALALFDQIKMDFRSAQQWLTSIGNVFFIFLIGHWCVCSWVFLIDVVEDRYQTNWFDFWELESQELWEVYIRNWYAIANIVSSVGSGDVYGTTDLERLFFIILMTSADIVFALAFGLLAEVTSNQRANNPQQNFFNSMVQSERIMQQCKFNANWKDRVQQYMTYKHQLKTSSKNLNADDLRDNLPNCLIKEILYHSNRAFLLDLFSGIESENLMRDLAFATKTQIFMPDDVIVRRSKMVDNICYIVEGTAVKLDKKNKQVDVLTQGQFCGEFGLLKQRKAQFTVRADTFMLMKVLKQSDIESILSHYSEFKRDILLARYKSNKNLMAKLGSLVLDQGPTSQNDIVSNLPLGSVKEAIEEHDINDSQIQMEHLEQMEQTSPDQTSSAMQTSESSDNDSEEEEEEPEAMEPLPRSMRQQAYIRERRQTLDPQTFFVQQQRERASPSRSIKSSNILVPFRQSRESLASMVRQEYQKKKQPKPKMTRRLSQVSIGSKLVINQMDGRTIAFDVDNS